MKTQEYNKWVDENIKDKKSSIELKNAIRWMESNSDIVDPLLNASEIHPGIQFSHVIESLIDGFKDNKTYQSLIIDWLVEDDKVPFGKILKTKALRRIKKYYIRFDIEDIRKLTALYDKLNSLEFKPSEYKWLDRIMKRCV